MRSAWSLYSSVLPYACSPMCLLIAILQRSGTKKPKLQVPRKQQICSGPIVDDRHALCYHPVSDPVAAVLAFEKCCRHTPKQLHLKHTHLLLINRFKIMLYVAMHDRCLASCYVGMCTPCIHPLPPFQFWFQAGLTCIQT